MRSVAFCMLVACGSAAPPVAQPKLTESPAEAAEPPAAVEPPAATPAVATRTAIEQAPPRPANRTAVELTSSPIHRQVAWLVELVSKRKGIADHAELTEHFGRVGPVSELPAMLRSWGEEAAGAYVEQLEIDEPKYVRGYIAAGAKRWRLKLELNNSQQIEHCNIEPVQ